MPFVTPSCNRLPITAPNVIPLSSTTFIVQNVIIIGLILVTVQNMILQLSPYLHTGLILVTAPNAFPANLFINPSVPTLYLKDPRIRNDTINPEFLPMVRMVRWNKLSRCWQLKDEKNPPSTINNHLLERIGVTVIFPIYFIENCTFTIHICCSMFRLYTVIREIERVTESMNRDKKRFPQPDLNSLKRY